jgi:hypothetical protein
MANGILQLTLKFGQRRRGRSDVEEGEIGKFLQLSERNVPRMSRLPFAVFLAWVWV